MDECDMEEALALIIALAKKQGIISIPLIDLDNLSSEDAVIIEKTDEALVVSYKYTGKESLN